MPISPLTSPATGPDHTRSRRRLGAGALLFAVGPALAACGSTGTPGAAVPAATPTGATSASASGATVGVASSSLGPIVVDAQGRTLYMFTKDTKGAGASSCAGKCATAWPALMVEGTPTANGVQGTLGVLTTTGGKHQVTLGGWPLYYFAKDAAAGDVRGQDVGKVWYVLDPTGKPVTTSPSGTTTAPPATGSDGPADGGGSAGGY